MASNPYVNKVDLADGTSLIDISDTTAVAADVAAGKYFYLATGQKVQGSGSGGGGGTVTIQDTTDSHGGTVRKITVSQNATVVESLSVTQNGTYTPSSGHAYGPVVVNVSGGGGGGGDATLAAVLDGTATALSLPSSVTALREYALYFLTSLTSLSGSGVLTVGRRACSNCESLETISLPNATQIGDSAFAECQSLSSVSLPSAVEIGESAFAYNYDAANFTSISLPEVTDIGMYAFSDDYYLTSISVPKCEYIGDGAFSGTSIASISLPSLLGIYADYVFSYCESLTTIYIGPDCEYISDYAFEELPSGVTINCGFSSSDPVAANAPWGASTATINYNVSPPS